MDQSVVAALKTHLSGNPWDVEAWDSLAGVAAATGTVDQQRDVYEQITNQFPTAAIYWQKYAELELDESDSSRAKLVFSRCLLSCPHIKLWSLYLRFIKKMNEARGTDGLIELRKSYEYTLERVGADAAAGPLWQEYINFLAGPRTGTPAYQALFGGGLPGQEEGQRVLWLRRAYHKALLVPGKHLDQVWRMYEEFERRSSNAQLARREIDEQRPRYQAAKAAATERARHLDRLKLHALATPPGKGGWRQQQQAAWWKEYISWERSNPQRLDRTAHSQRVALAYEQALMPLMHFPEVWHGLARWHASESGLGVLAAAAVYTRARTALPDCTMLHFAAADLEEGRGELEAARTLYEELVQGLPAVSGEEQLPDAVKEAATLVWIQYMRFARRADSVAASRKVFLRARRWHGCTWQAFVAAAHMEYAGDGNDKVARNIFELGLEHYLMRPPYVLAYADFLAGLADVHNARALFERALGETPAAESRPLWDRYIQFQSLCGDLATVTQLENRRREALGDAAIDDLSPLTLKYRFLDMWPCSSLQKTHLQRLTGELPPIAEPGASAPSQPAVKVETPTAGGQIPAPGPTKMEPIKQMPAELGMFLAALPPARTLELPHAPVEAVIEVLLMADLSPSALAALEAAAVRLGPKSLPPPLSHPQQGKREREDADTLDAPEHAPAVDMYRARVKQRIRRTG